MKNGSCIRVLIVGDHAIVRRGLALLLRVEAGFEVVGEAENGICALDLVPLLKPHLILLDLIMAEMDGIATAMALRTSAPDVRVLVLTGTESRKGVAKPLIRALSAGIRSCIPKDACPEDLVEAARLVAQGKDYLHPLMLEHIPHWETSNGNATLNLTPREQEILLWMATPATYREIASFLQLGEETVRSHAKNILAKLHKPNRSQAVLEAVKDGFIELPH